MRCPAPERASLTYAFDAYCAWCFGFGLRSFAEDNAHRIWLGVVPAGLYTGAQRCRPRPIRICRPNTAPSPG
ncbi:hypothetical protein [Streptomyces sp. SAS_276]|uniref:hypothetical protein n=1 Tax=Streptomyces sp. SAS_276 TaxID=3412745 RepID=UPI00403C922A